MQDFKIATCQMNVVDNKQQNINHAIDLIKRAKIEQPDVELVCLPEIFNGPYDNGKFIEYAEEEDTSQTLEAIKKTAKQLEVYIQSGSIPELCLDKIYNTAYLINPVGEIIAKHRKMHMFDINTDSMKFTESDTLTPGDSITTVKTSLGRISLAICYDIRFPEYWSVLSKNKTDIVLMPAAFNLTTGPLHWKMLIQARAVDTQAYVVATSPSQVQNPYYVAWGHSMIVDPWGKIITDAGADEEILFADITEDKIIDVRTQIPTLKNRRDDIYDTIVKNRI